MNSTTPRRPAPARPDFNVRHSAEQVGSAPPRPRRIAGTLSARLQPSAPTKFQGGSQ